MDLKSRDVKVIGSLLTLWILSAFIGGHFRLMEMFGPVIELPLDLLTALTGILSVFFIYKSVNVFGGDMTRYLSVVGAGISIFALSLAPHIWMHINNPSIAGFFVFAHVLTGMSFLTITYGFYLLSRGGEQ